MISSTILGYPADSVAALATLATALVALIAALYARGQVGEARRLREEQAQPYVVVDIEPSPHHYQALELVISNIGTTLAHDVKFSFDPPLSRAWRKEQDPNEWRIIKEGIPSMPPGKSYRMWLDIGHERHAAGLMTAYDVVVTFTDSRRRPLEPLRYVLDLDVYSSPNHLGIRTTHHVGQAVEEIAKNLKSWNSRGRLSVTAWDGDKRDADDLAEDLEWQRRHEAENAKEDAPD